MMKIRLPMRRIFLLWLLLLPTVVVGCSGSSGPSATPTAPTPQVKPAPTAPAPTPTVPEGVGTLVGAGDIAWCGLDGAAETAKLLDGLPGTVFTAGDNVYMHGLKSEFDECYEPTWGRHKSRTRPTAGNHEYESGAVDYFIYFGANAGPAGLGYYRYSVGPWTILALNSELPSGPGSAQGEWLRQELATQPTLCTAAIWHRPLFTSGPNGSNTDMRDVWRVLYEFNVDVVINGHDHLYERFAPQDPDGRPDPVRGIRQFTIGTGGALLYQPVTVSPNSEVRQSAWGVGMFTLTGTGYQWEFIPADPSGPHDSGFGSCH
jgi:hypothetical protein